MSHRRSSGDGSFYLALLILGFFGVLFAWLVRFLLRLWNAIEPYTPRSLYDPRQVVATRRYWILWGVVVLGVPFFLFPSLLRRFSLTEGNTVFLFAFYGLVALGSGYFFQRRLTPRISSPDLTNALLYHRQELTRAKTYRIFPRKVQPDYIIAQKLMSALLATMPRLYFRVVGTPGAIFWEIIDPSGSYYPQAVTEAVQGFLGAETGIEIQTGLDPDIPKRLPFYRDHLYFRLANEYVAPLYFPDQLKNYDPLPAIVQRMDFLEARYEERITYQLFVFTETEDARHRGARRFHLGAVRSQSLLHQHDKKAQTTGLNERFVSTKLDHNLYHAMLLVTVESKDRTRLQQLAQIAATVCQYGTQGHNNLERYEGLSVSQYAPDRRIDTEQLYFETLAEEMLLKWVALAEHWRDMLLVLSPLELTCLWHLPDETFTAKNITWAGVTIPIELTRRHEHSLYLGHAIAPGRKLPVYLSAHDRAYHHYLLGKTGMGKSTYLLNWILEDIAAGHGVAVIDPHGKLTRQILSCLPGRADEVLLLDCSTTAYPVPLNPFRVSPGADRTAVIENTKWALEQIYQISRYPQLELVFGYLLETLTLDPAATPLDISRFFNDANYHEYILSLAEKSRDLPTATINYWRHTFANESKSRRQEITRPIINRTRAFLGNRALELMTCHPNTLNYVHLVKSKRIVILNLEGEAVKNEGAALTTLFVASLAGACQSLKELPDGAPPRMYLYIDEVERVMSPAYVKLLSEIRKFGLSLVLVNQFLEQLPKDTISGIKGNVGTLISFEIGSEDARNFAPYFEPGVTREQLMNLGAYRVAVRTRAGGKTLPAFLVSCPNVPTTNGDPAPVTNLNGNGTDGILPEGEVMTWLEQRYPRGEDGGETSSRKPPPRRRGRAMSKYEPADGDE